MKPESIRYKIRSIALSVLFSATGLLFVMILKLLGVEISKVQKGIVSFLVTTILALSLFPKVFKIPFGKIRIAEWLSNLGVYFPKKFIYHILLGVILAIISLSGMLIASLITGKYEFSLKNISLGHFIFSLTPGIWEEIFFRGVIMIVLISIFKDLKKAFWWQVLIFAICHFKSASIVGVIDMVSVAIIAITLTLVAVKSRSLIAGIIYHYIHDAFLFLVQNPGGDYFGFQDNFTFFIFLWSAMFINIMIINLAADVLKIKGDRRIFAIEGIDGNFTLMQHKKNKIKTSKIEKISFLIYAIVCLLTVFDNKLSGFNFANSFSSLCFFVNMAFFILSFRQINVFFYFVFFFNSINSFVTGYMLNQSGSQRVYIFYYLIGVVYILVALYTLSLNSQKNLSKS